MISNKNLFLSVVVVLATLASTIFSFEFETDLKSREKRQDIDVVVIGNLKTLMHQVGGTVYAYNKTMLIIDDFTFDGNGAGVYINVATKGKKRADFVKNRITVDYPAENPRAIERRYPKRGLESERLFISLPAGVTVDKIKWLSIWCEIFRISFGEITFPGYVKNAFD